MTEWPIGEIINLGAARDELLDAFRTAGRLPARPTNTLGPTQPHPEDQQ